MRKLFARIIVLLTLLAVSAECSGSGAGSGQSFTTFDPSQPSTMSWSAAVTQPITQPVTPIVVTPGQTIIIIIDLVPINGVVFTPPVFFNAFTSVNPNLVFLCPGLLTVGSPIIGPVTTGGIPSVVFPITPVGFGSCVFPINAGFAGIIPLNVQVSGSTVQSASQRRYVVRLATGPPSK